MAARTGRFVWSQSTWSEILLNSPVLDGPAFCVAADATEETLIVAGHRGTDAANSAWLICCLAVEFGD